MPYTQENALIAIDTPLGPDVLLLTGFIGTEEISRLFSFELEMLSENHSVSFEDIIGKSVTISVILADEEKRYFNGIISSFTQGRGGGEGGGDLRFSHYKATMVPWLWLLTRTSDSRIFQKLSVPDIIEKVFNEKKLLDFKLQLHGSYAKRDYCVQYRETDFNFISRLMEEEGIYYFFEHGDGKHTLVIADSPQDHKPCPKQESARYQLSAGGRAEEDVVLSLEKMQEIMPGKYTLNDFNFEMPNTDLKVDAPSKQKLGPGEREIYDYPGEYSLKKDGDRLANIRMEEEEAQITRITGSGNCRAFTSGYRFTLADFYRSDMNDKDYVLTSIEHEAKQSLENASEAAYRNRFDCMPHEVPFRPRRMTPRPSVLGSQTAIVVGPAGEEIYTDEHGRVKVQFHWDREGKRDENSSCWIRVAQVWAGASWGAMYIPRIGHEVIVDFLEGDPDRPIITGRVYHGSNKPPYPLPDEKTKSTIKSDSTLGGGGSNEFRYEDKKGQEEIYLHGQKDWTIVIRNNKNQSIGHDETLTVGHNRTKEVKVDQSETVGVNKTISVGANHDETIGANKTLNVGANHTETIGSSMSVTVGMNKTETVAINSAETIGAAKELTIGGLYQVTVGAVMNETVGGARMEEVGGVKGETVAGAKTVKVGGRFSETAGGPYTLKAPNITLTADKITLKTSGGKIVMDGSGVTIKGSKVQIKSSGDVTIKGSKITEN